MSPTTLLEAPWAIVDLSPGLLVAAAALGLDRLLRALGDAIPWRAWATFLLLVTLLLGGPLFGGKPLLPIDGLRGTAPFRGLAPTDPPGNPLQGDQLQLLLPAQAAARAAWRDGRWPLRNARLGGPTADLQVPVLGDPQAQALQPLALATLPLSLLAAPAALAALRLLCAFAFFFVFARRMELSTGAALVGAVTWTLCGFTQLWLGWPIATTAALLPAALYAVAALAGAPRRRHRLFAAAVGAALLCGGHPETIAFAVLLVVGFAIARARRGTQPGRWLWRVCLPSALLSLALAAPALVPAFEAGQRSERSAERSADHRPTAHPRDDLARRLVPIAAPNAFGNDRFARQDGVAYWGRHNINEDASGFAGTFSLLAVLVTVSAWAAARARRGEWRWRRGERLVLSLGALALVWIALPVSVRATSTPDFLEPLLRVEEHRALLLVAFALAFGTACAVDRARDRAVASSSLLVGALAAALGALLFWAYRAHPFPADPTALTVLRDGWLSLQAKILALSALYWLWAARERWAPAAAIFLVASELLVAHAPANPSAPRMRALPSTPAIELLRERAALDPVSTRIAALDGALPSGLAALYGLADVRAYNPMAPLALPRTLETVDPSVLAPLGARVLLTEPGAHVAGLTLLYEGSDARLWRIEGAPPTSLSARVYGPDRAALAAGLSLCALGIALALAAFPPPRSSV